MTSDPLDLQGIDYVEFYVSNARQAAHFYRTALGRAFLEKASSTNANATSLFNDQTQLEGILNLNAQQTAGLGRNDLLLAARAANLGAALTTLPLWNLFALRSILGLPWNITPCAVIPLGWPLGRYGPTTRKAVRDVVSFDRSGNRLG